MKSTNSALLLLFLMMFWWLFWLCLSLFSPTGLSSPSFDTVVQHLLLTFSLSLGYVLCLIFLKLFSYPVNHNNFFYIRYCKSSLFSNLILFNIFLLLLISLMLSGFFAMSYMDYHVKVRSFGFGDSLTGYKFLDLLLKVVIYPLLVYYCVVLFSQGVKISGLLYSLCIFLYVILWQVNYPLIMLFWVVFFSGIVLNSKGMGERFKFLFIVFSIFVILLMAATLRYGAGSFSFEVVEHYFINYHIIGYSFYDYHFSDDNSILFQHTYGLSSAGFFEQFVELFLRFFGFEFNSASFENREFNMTPVPIGNGFQSNAFGTILFSFYRDFSYVGVFLGGFLYGFFTCKMYLNSEIYWRSKAMCLVLLYGWFTGMMVSPVEQGYFWFCAIVLFFFSKLKVVTNG